MRRLTLFLLAAATAAQESDPAGYRKALAKVRALEGEIETLVAEIAPAVGAVVNHSLTFEPKTGVVALRPYSLGSGVLITRTGYCLTNVHVVDKPGYLTVSLPDGVRYPAARHADTGGVGASKRKRGAPAKGDIAVLKLRGKKSFPFADWRAGDADRLEPGQFVFALGNPYGHALDGVPVVTMGVVSGKGRAAAESGYLYLDTLQTDAEINPGNSGGPLFDARGNLVGINGLMKSLERGSNTGVGFAIPINQVRLFLRDLLKGEGGSVGYGFHGLTVRTDASGKGVRVFNVVSSSPAEDAGLRNNDLITKVNGKAVRNRSDFVNTVGKLPEETVVRIGYRRHRRYRTVRVRLVSYEDHLTRLGRSPVPERTGPWPLHERAYLGAHWKDGRAGLRLTRVLPRTGARKAGLKPGDVLLSVGGGTVGKAADLVRLLAMRRPGEQVAVRYERDGRKRTTRVTLCDAGDAAELGS